jgi:predicted dithiol-disulfide oxidoreductase (DUF899 family)
MKADVREIRGAKMSYKATAKKIKDYRRQIAGLREKMRAAQAKIEPEEVKDYAFGRSGGDSVKLSELFGDKDTLFVVHNMGASCPYCTLWADGFNGVFDHLRNRVAFVLASPDPPQRQQKFAQGRGWRFPMVSCQDSTFPEDMGYWRDGPMPGVSVFKRAGGKIVRVADTSFGPGDDFCGVWHFLDLIPEGAAGWQPKFKYAS